NLFTKKAADYRSKKRTGLNLSVHLADHCNLNCKGCDNFSCIADEKYHSPETEAYYNRIRIHSALDYLAPDMFYWAQAA
ncbi:MAG: hypothetical protein LBD48_07440, partial [Treponema sp.]|nr:hypothetical protein [Treponema sp.]